MSTPLTDFLLSLQTDSNKVLQFNGSTDGANALMDAAQPPLSSEARAALLSHDARAIYWALKNEGWNQSFRIGCGPTMEPPSPLMLEIQATSPGTGSRVRPPAGGPTRTATAKPGGPPRGGPGKARKAKAQKGKTSSAKKAKKGKQTRGGR